MEPHMKILLLAVLLVSTGTSVTGENHKDLEGRLVGANDGAEGDCSHAIPDAEYEQFVYNPHIVINPPNFSAALQACCNCSAVREIVAAELVRVVEAYNHGREDTRRQLKQLQTAVSDLAAALEKLPDTKSITVTQETTTQEPVTRTPPRPRSTTTKLPRTTAAAVETTTTKTTTTMPTSTPPRIFSTTPPPPPPPTTVQSQPGISYKDCSEALAAGEGISGIYTIQPLDGGMEIEAYCDMETDGGGWTVFQRRQDGTVDFYRNFTSYSKGFGDLEGEFWLGNENLHRLTSQDRYELRVDLSDFEGNSVFAVYNLFRVGDAEDNYRLTVGGFSGNAGDSLSSHNNKPFTTKDRDNDDLLTGNCARTYYGAWWYERCHQANLNGDYLGGATNIYARGVVWRRWKGYRYSLRTSEMKFRKKN